MRINADFSRKAAVRPEDYRWVGSPSPGVERVMLDRIGDEVARATSLVRYAPNSEFPPHVHGGGEEFLVLEGTFGDEHRRYPAGCYVRNPIGTAHAPRVGADGCVLFVKLRQFDPGDDRAVVVETRTAKDWAECAPGLETLELHRFRGEHVSLVRAAPGTALRPVAGRGGAEVLVLEGGARDADGDYPAGSWLRYPDLGRFDARAGDDGALLYLKRGHLPPGAPPA